LFLACASGSHIKTATLSGVRGAGKVKGNEFLTFKLEDILVSSVQQGDSDDAAPVDQFSLSFTKVQFTYIPQSAKGGPAPPVTASWDVKQNKKV
jgi:type VI secretion system secreted protein Hcp